MVLVLVLVLVVVVVVVLVVVVVILPLAWLNVSRSKVIDTYCVNSGVFGVVLHHVLAPLMLSACIQLNFTVAS